jgi:predicted HAD superfamily Cof-like phosphohydrolase
VSSEMVLNEGDRVRVESAETYERWGYRPMVGLHGTVRNETPHGQFVVILEDGRELYFDPEEIVSVQSEQVRALAEFHDHPNATTDTNAQALRRTLQNEEHTELMFELNAAVNGRGNLERIAREIADVLYVTYGTAWAFGIDADAAFAEVHRAAMKKMNAGLRREDGKILKPPGFVPPDMTRAVRDASLGSR